MWECRTDAVKFFFPPADFDPSPAPAMLSCTTLDTTPVGRSRLLSPAHSEVRRQPVDDGAGVAAPKTSSAPEHGDVRPSERKQGASGSGGDKSLRPRSPDVTGERKLGDERGGIKGGVAAAATTAAGGERRGRRSRQRDSGGGGGRGGSERHSKSDTGTTGINLLRPFVIDLKEEVRRLAPKTSHAAAYCTNDLKPAVRVRFVSIKHRGTQTLTWRGVPPP